jgi:hypothetical protein
VTHTGCTRTLLLLAPACSLWAASGYFFNKLNLAVGHSPAAVVSGDFNGDGRLDLAAANSADNSVSILLGAPNASFTVGTTLSTGFSNPVALALADFNGDGKLDLAVVNAGSNSVDIELSNGDGTFHAGNSYATGSDPVSIAAGDFNGDGKPDLAIANYNSGTVTILLNAGGGNFMAVPAVYMGGQLNAIAAGDFNRDGKTDLAVSNASPNIGVITVLISNGDGTFLPHSLTANNAIPTSVAVGDVNGDGYLDIFEGETNGYCAFLGDGMGAFDTGYCGIAVGMTINAVALGNFSGGSAADAVVATARALAVLISNGDGTFKLGSEVNAGTQTVSLAAGDFSGDGKLDLAAADMKDNSVAVLLNNGTGSFPLEFPRERSLPYLRHNHRRL